MVLHPREKVKINTMGVVQDGKETQAEAHLSHLSVEVLRDLARNEAASKEWRKAAVELLMEKDHPYADHPELRQLVYEIRAEKEARQEVESLAAQKSSESEQAEIASEVTKAILEKPARRFEPTIRHITAEETIS